VLENSCERTVLQLGRSVGEFKIERSEVVAMKEVRSALLLTLALLSDFAFAQTEQGFSLKVLELRGSVEALLPDGSRRSVKTDEQLPIGSSVRTGEKSAAVLLWMPYKARVKLASETEVQLSPTRVLSLKQGRIWLGTPPPPVGERRFPLPVQCRQVQIVSSPEAFFSVAAQPDGKVIVSVDQGSVFVSVEEKVVTVPKGRMVIVLPQNVVVGPMPMTKQEQLLWDMGGIR